MHPIISIVVPTKNRYKYLTHLITLVEGFNDKRIELVVHDNSDDNLEIIDFLKGKSLLSTVYFYDTDKLSMGENAERGINKCTGEYVCFIGDDDAVCRNIADCAEWMRKNDFDALRSLYLNYIWNENIGDKKGLLYYDEISLMYKIGNPVNELIKILKSGVPHFGHMAKIYHGIVKRSLLQEIQNKYGTLFPGPTPDMSGAVSISPFLKKFAMIEVPVILPGMSRMVGGGVMGKVLTLDEVKFITDRDRNNWEKDFPKLWATELIWPDCALKALRNIKHEELIKYLNRNKILSRLVVIHKSYLKEAYNYSFNKISFLFSFTYYLFSEGLKYFYRRKILSVINGKLNGIYYTHKNLGSISDAEEYLMNKVVNIKFDNLKLKQ